MVVRVRPAQEQARGAARHTPPVERAHHCPVLGANSPRGRPTAAARWASAVRRERSEDREHGRARACGRLTLFLIVSLARVRACLAPPAARQPASEGRGRHRLLPRGTLKAAHAKASAASHGGRQPSRSGPQACASCASRARDGRGSRRRATHESGAGRQR